MDRIISQMFQVGCTDSYVHKYLGPKNLTTGTPDQPVYDSISPTNIQDLLLLENRDRKYDTEIYRIRCHYNVQNIDFNLSQFGLFIDNDTLFLTVHINDWIKTLGRKPLSGDVVELPHLRDEFAFNTGDVSLPRYYVIEDVGRASEGFSATWYPHLYRIKLRRMSGGQQFADIINVPIGEDADLFVGDYASGTVYYPGQIVRLDGQLYQVKTDGSVPSTGTTLPPGDITAWNPYSGDTLSTAITTRKKDLEINDAVINQAEADSPKSGYETRQFFTLAVDQITGKPRMITIGDTVTNAGPIRSGYTGYLLGDGFPLNGYDFGYGPQFPENPVTNDYYLRTDMLPNRLYRYETNRWIKMEDDVRMTMTNNDSRQTQKTGFINNTNFMYTEEVGFDAVQLPVGAISFNTTIDYVAAPYIRLKLDSFTMDYVLAEYPTVITKYTDPELNARVRITLPVIETVQQTIPTAGTWLVQLFNHREAQRQNIHTALKPQADL